MLPRGASAWRCIDIFDQGTPISGGGNFDGFVSIFSSDHQNVNLKPKWRVFHTNVSSLNITSPNSSYNADDSTTLMSNHSISMVFP